MDLAAYIEHTNLSPTSTITEIDELVDEARQLGLFGVCVPPFWVKRARREIGTSSIALVTVAGFPFGYSMTETKLDEISRAIDNGADEIDVVLNISSFKSGLPWTKIELAKCSKKCHDNQKAIKIILETTYLSDDELVQACKLCADAGADFVKASSATSSIGITTEQIHLMRKALPKSVSVAAFGRISSYEQATKLMDAGAERLATSVGVRLIK